MQHDPDNAPFDDEEEFVSKSQLKREAHALKDLGDELSNLKPEQLAAIPMEDNLREAIEETRRLKARNVRSGLKRQLQYLGKLMRRAEVEPIEEALARIQGNHAEEKALLHRSERWRDRLIEEGDGALGELLDEYPQADRQHLRQLIRNAQREQKAGKPPKSAREIFREIRDLVGG